MLRLNTCGSISPLYLSGNYSRFEWVPYTVSPPQKSFGIAAVSFLTFFALAKVLKHLRQVEKTVKYTETISFFCTAWYSMCSWHFVIWHKYHYYLLGAVLLDS